MTHECLHHTCASTGYAHNVSDYSLKGVGPRKFHQGLPIRFVAAEAGFLPPGPCVDFADMVCRLGRHGMRWLEYNQSKEVLATKRMGFRIE